jgi:hypothetical protein
MKGAYLKPSDAAVKLGISASTMKRRIRDGSVPVLVFSDTLRRVEASTLVPGAPAAEDPPAEMGTADLAIWFDLHPTTVLALAKDGVIPSVMVGGRLVVRRRPLLRFICDHTIGD